MLSLIKDNMRIEGNSNDEIYNIITRWPFACFFTTNYDDEIQNHLRTNKRFDFVTVLNTKEDFCNFRSDMKDFIFKIHGSLDNSLSAIVTEEDYNALIHNPNWEYYRKGLGSVFSLFNVLIIGYSLSDPDMDYLIQSIKEFTSPVHPIYMFLDEVSHADIKRFRTNYNIQIFKYRVYNKDHSQLARMLKTLDSFLIPQSLSPVRLTEDSLKAASLYSFRVLNQAKENLDLENYILMIIPEPAQKGSSIEEIKSKVNIPNLDVDFNVYMSGLQNKGLVQQNNGQYNRTLRGDELVNQCLKSTQNIETIAIDTALDSLKKRIPVKDETRFKALIKDALIYVFERKGMIIVKRIYSDAITSGESIDIFEDISHIANSIDDVEARIAFIQVMRDFILFPTNHQKQYLESLSQGFFLFYMMGNNTSHTEFRKEVFTNTYWFVDSNILIPVLAKGCFNHDFVEDLFAKFKENGARLFVTDKVLLEVKEHLNWALKNCRDNAELYANAILLGGTKQNLFIDGFLHQKNTKKATSFNLYCRQISKMLDNGARDFLEKYNISVINLDLSTNKNKDQFIAERSKLEILRTKMLSYRSPLQVETEAELLILMSEFINQQSIVYFLSQSTIFTKTDTKIQTWSGEAAYRYLLSLPNSSPSPHLHECLLNELYASGISFIDKNTYNTFFSEDIELAKLKYEEEKTKYIELLGTTYSINELDLAFNATPDLEKPLFVAQMATKIADISSKKYQEIKEENRVKSSIIDSKNKEIEKLKRNLEKAKNEVAKAQERVRIKNATMRNAKDPKHVTKRERQQKKRNRKK